MYQIDVATAATALPTPAAPGTEGFFTDGNPASGLPATIVDADFMNMLMMELINLVEAAGQSPSKTTYNQVLTAIKTLGQQSAGNVGTDTGAANAYVVAFTPTLTAPVPWVPFWFKVKTTNTGASTLNATGTVEPLVGGAHLALQGGEMLAGGNALVYWNPTLNSGSGSYVLMFCSGAPDQVAAGSQSEHAAQIGQVQTGSLNYAVAGGTSDALTATLPAGVTALTDGFPLRLKLGAANTTTTPTLNVTIGTTATGALTIVKGANAALVAGDLPGSGAEAWLVYNATNANWVLTNPATGAITPGSAPGFFSNLKMSAPGNAASVSVSYNALTLFDGSGNFMPDTNVAGTITTTATGAGGLDTGMLAASTVYYAYRIAQPGGTKNWLFSLSSTAPTMPSGYTLKARIGAFVTDGTANKYPLGFTQDNDFVTLKIGSGNVSTPPAIATASSAVGTISSTTFTPVAVPLTGFIPTTASQVRVGLASTASGVYAAAAVNASRGGWLTLNPPEMAFNGNTEPFTTYADLQLEAMSLQWAATGAGPALLLIGWKDNL